MNTRWSYSNVVLVICVGVALILPTARAVGLIHLSWWICAAPFGILFLLCGAILIFAGLIGHAAFLEEQRDVASNYENDGASPPNVSSEAADTSAAFVSTRFLTKK